MRILETSGSGFFPLFCFAILSMLPWVLSRSQNGCHNCRHHIFASLHPEAEKGHFLFSILLYQGGKSFPQPMADLPSGLVDQG